MHRFGDGLGEPIGWYCRRRRRGGRGRGCRGCVGSVRREGGGGGCVSVA